MSDEASGGFDLMKLFSAAKQVKESLDTAQQKLDSLVVEGESGGGMVVVKATARQRVLSVTIDPTVLEANDPGMLQDLLVAAMNRAVEKGQERAKQEMQGELGRFAGILPIPGLFG